MNDRAFASATELTNEIRDRRIGCVELLDFYLARAERHNPTLNAIIVWQIDQARERARAADDALARGERWGPLHGIPMTVKESFNVAGLPTTFGNPLWKDNIAADNAFLIDRLLQAGAIVFGKTNVPYMLADAQSYNDIYGTTNNPWDLTRAPGGSSGGEAATLAAGLSGLGAGSDIAGSLRNPAHYSGVYGHKPTWGLISTRGHAPPGILTPTDISVVGPMARHAEDLDLALRALAGPDLLQRAAWRVELPPPRRRRLRTALSPATAGCSPRICSASTRCRASSWRTSRRRSAVPMCSPITSWRSTPAGISRCSRSKLASWAKRGLTSASPALTSSNSASYGQAVYEPFSGSGTTIEIAPAYVDVAVKRWQEFTGQQAVLDGDGRSFDNVAAQRAR
jgi:hypothetical protein